LVEHTVANGKTKIDIASLANAKKPEAASGSMFGPMPHYSYINNWPIAE
jgi:hypothetical protein